MERPNGCDRQRKPYSRRAEVRQNCEFDRNGVRALWKIGSLRFSGSMEPAFHRGDLLFLTNNREEPIRAGEIVVFKVEGRDIPIVHRVLKLHEK